MIQREPRGYSRWRREICTFFGHFGGRRSIIDVHYSAPSAGHSASRRTAREAACSGSDDDGDVAIWKKRKMRGGFRRGFAKNRMNSSTLIVDRHLYIRKPSQVRCADYEINKALRLFSRGQLPDSHVGFHTCSNGRREGRLRRNVEENFQPSFSKKYCAEFQECPLGKWKLLGRKML